MPVLSRIAILALLSFPLPAPAAEFHGSVTDVDGRPVPGATVAINGVEATVVDGRFSAITDDDVVTMRFSAPGHFPMLHTYSRADIRHSSKSPVEVPPVQLVARTPDRRLLLFAGDTMMGRRYTAPLADEKVLVRPDQVVTDMRNVLRHVRPYIRLADFASVNLETQLAETTPANPLGKSVAFFTHPAIADALSWAGVDYVALGNNHSYDFQEEGLAQTLHALRRAELPFSGAGHDEDQARRPAELDIGGQDLWLYSYVGWPGRFVPKQVAGPEKGGAAYGTAESVLEDLAALPPSALGVFQYHSGLEYVSEPPLAEETQLLGAVVKCADIGIGHHSHVIQGFEVYRGKLLAYSLGNFAFDQYIPSTHSSMLLYAWYDGDRLYRAEAVPLHISDYTPTPATGAMRYDILQRLARLSDRPSTCTRRSGAHLVIEPCSSPRPAFQDVVVNEEDVESGIVRLSDLGAKPLPAVRRVDAPGPYRLGLDLARRGDFEYHGLFGTADRYWQPHPSVSIVGGPSKALQVVLDSDMPVTTGMKVFTRVFARSAPATLFVKTKSDGDACVRFSLQRRLDGVGLGAALADGPLTELGQIRVPDGAAEFSMDFQLPRTSTRSIRLLMEAKRCGKGPVTVQFDDLAMIEWQTPWLEPGTVGRNPEKTQATHLQTRSLRR